jgi:hypothetical protein
MRWLRTSLPMSVLASLMIPVTQFGKQVAISESPRGILAPKVSEPRLAQLRVAHGVRDRDVAEPATVRPGSVTHGACGVRAR